MHKLLGITAKCVCQSRVLPKLNWGVGHLGYFLTEINLQTSQPMLSSNSANMSHTVRGRMEMGIRHQTQTAASLGASHLSGGVGGWQGPKSLAPPMDSKPQKEDISDIDEERGHLYDRVKILYKEGLKTKASAYSGNRRCHFDCK